MSRWSAVWMLVLFASIGCTPASALQRADSAAAVAADQPDPVALLRAKRELTEANYKGDLPALARLADELGAMGGRDSLAGLARYHAGFAHYVLAMMVGPNGLRSRDGDMPEMYRHVDAGIAQLEASVRTRADFADALALLSQLYAMKLRSDPQRFARDLGPKGDELLQRALELEPRNPRVVLIDAMRLFWSPAHAGGDRVQGLARWKEATDLFAAEAVPDTSALPGWGHAEAWAWLPAAYLALRPPDLAEAERAATRALEVRPDFRWARTSVLPQIEAARRRQ